MAPSPGATPDRLAEVRRRVVAACERAGRDPAAVRIVAVSKGHSVEDISQVLGEGIQEFGESRVNELIAKATAIEAAGQHPTWHFVGHLQRNKALDAVPHIDVLHSLDSPRLIELLEKRFPESEQKRELAHADDQLPCYLEVNVAAESQKHGVLPDQLEALLDAATSSPVLRIDGLMTVAPRVTDPEDVRPVFRRLRELAQRHGLEGLSMGMTDDFEVAIEEGATVVRIGRAIFGG